MCNRPASGRRAIFRLMDGRGKDRKGSGTGRMMIDPSANYVTARGPRGGVEVITHTSGGGGRGGVGRRLLEKFGTFHRPPFLQRTPMATPTQLQSLKLALSFDRPPLCGGAISPPPEGLYLYYGKKDPRYLWPLLHTASCMIDIFLPDSSILPL